MVLLAWKRANASRLTRHDERDVLAQHEIFFVNLELHIQVKFRVKLRNMIQMAARDYAGHVCLRDIKRDLKTDNGEKR